MPLSKHLHRRLQEALGAEAAGDLVSLLEAMDANRADISELRHEMELGFTRIDARFLQMEERLNSTLQKALREHTRFFFLAWSVLMAMLVGLYSR